MIGWIKIEGEEITAGEGILTIETDEVNYDIEAPESGILARILVQAEEVVPVGAPMAVITGPGESGPVEFGEGSRGGQHAENPMDKPLSGE